MSDAYLRELERLALAGDADAQIRFLQELLRTTHINNNALRLASYLRYEPANVLAPCPDAIFTEISSIGVEYRRELEHVIRNLFNISGDIQAVAPVKSKNESDLVGSPEIVVRALFAAIRAAISAVTSTYIQDYHTQINFHIHDNYQRLVEMFMRNTDFEILEPARQKIDQMHQYLRTETPFIEDGEELTYRVLFNGIERLGRALSILFAPEFEDHDTVFLNAANETLQSAVSVANLVIQGNNWSIIRDAIRNDLVGWLFYRDLLRELVE